MDVIELIREYGTVFYVIVFVWTFLEGETFVIIAGLAAKQELIRLDLLIAIAAMGSFCGDQLYFFIGRRYGHRLLNRFPRIKPGVNQALSLLHRYSTWFILGYRYMYGVRNFASIAMGMSEVTWRKFVILNFISAWVWATTFAGGGYLIGAALERLLGDVNNAVLIGMGFGLILFLSFMFHAHKKHQAQQKAEAAAAAAAANDISAAPPPPRALP
ncbi:DedA family protein [Zavarzinia sp. CC-PAN008]|uniref:DedA family protein n=1 Tax=Zavarzinia sp. CC-PAN008 TaxID=3243332 RepID=UPI003F7454A4